MARLTLISLLKASDTHREATKFLKSEAPGELTPHMILFETH